MRDNNHNAADDVGGNGGQSKGEETCLIGFSKKIKMVIKQAYRGG